MIQPSPHYSRHSISQRLTYAPKQVRPNHDMRCDYGALIFSADLLLSDPVTRL